MQRYNKGADAIQALKNGKIDCVVIDSLPAEKFVAANDDLKIVEGIFDTEEYAMCIQFFYKFRYSFIDILRIHYAEKSLKLFFAL